MTPKYEQLFSYGLYVLLLCVHPNLFILTWQVNVIAEALGPLCLVRGSAMPHFKMCPIFPLAAKVLPFYWKKISSMSLFFCVRQK